MLAVALMLLVLLALFTDDLTELLPIPSSSFRLVVLATALPEELPVPVLLIDH